SVTLRRFVLFGLWLAATIPNAYRIPLQQSLPWHDENMTVNLAVNRDWRDGVYVSQHHEVSPGRSSRDGIARRAGMGAPDLDWVDVRNLDPQPHARPDGGDRAISERNSRPRRRADRPERRHFLPAAQLRRSSVSL